MLRESIGRCKAALPLPDLWVALGLPGSPRKNCKSPFRDDRSESFSVFERDGLWFWRDHAQNIGGDEIDFLEMTGLDKGGAIKRFHELAGVPMPAPRADAPAHKSKLGKLVKVYSYRNAQGQLVHQTCRFEPKNFRQRRPAAKGMHQGGREAKSDKNGDWWIWTLEGIEPVLYRLPELFAADPAAPVFLCEGEKDADGLAAYGAIATTAPMGAGKWRPSYTDTLRGRRVIIVADSDAAGRHHAELVAAELHEVAQSVDIVKWAKLCPDSSSKIDAADYIHRRNAAAGAAA